MPDQESLQPTTTAQEDLTTAGQRRINLIWEYTQAIIAISVVGTAMVCVVMSKALPEALIGLVFSVVGTYFSRTNYASIGGVGAKPAQPKYEGR